MVVKFYGWDPHGSALGHASLTLCDKTHISWWPGEEDRSRLTTFVGLNGCKGVVKSLGLSPLKISTVMLSVPLSMTCPMKPHCMASYKDDVMLEGREADRKVKLRDCLLNNAEIMSWWEQAKTTETYSLVMNNCATMVIRALKVGGASDFVGNPPDYYMWTPYRVYEYCEKLSNLRLSIK